MIGNKQIEKIICIACNDIMKDHSKRQLMRCLFRVQGSMLSDSLNKTGEEYKESALGQLENKINDKMQR
jgi:hypothetical protein